MDPGICRSGRGFLWFSRTARSMDVAGCSEYALGRLARHVEEPGSVAMAKFSSSADSLGYSSGRQIAYQLGDGKYAGGFCRYLSGGRRLDSRIVKASPAPSRKWISP